MACIGSTANSETTTITIKHMKKTILLFTIIGLLSFNTQQPKTVTISFTLEEVQMVYDALGELPAKKVEAIRGKIYYEVQRQLSDTTKKK